MSVVTGSSSTKPIRAAAVWPWVWGLAGVVVVLLAYSAVWHAAFIWDDDAHVTTNPVIIGPLGLWEIWTSAKANYFPLTMTSFWVQHALWGLAPGPYHVVSILFHAAGALLLWQVLRRLHVPGAWLGAMLWALHPVQVESVAWISELKNTQSGFFFLLAIWFFVRWMQREGGLALRRDYVLALVAATLAILSKSSTVMLPVVLGLMGWWTGKRRWRDAVWLAPFLAISVVASGWTIWEQKVNSMASGPEWSHGLAPRFAIAGKVIWFYLGKLVWPEPLIFIYPRWDVNDVGPAAWLPLVAAVALAGVLWRCRDGRLRPVFVGLGYFAISLFPVLGLFDVFFFRYSFVGDHFQYLASMGPLALAGAGISLASARLASASAPLRWAVPAALLIALGALTWRQSRIYQTNLALWQDTVARNPHAWIARVNLGSELEAAGRPDLALVHYEEAMRMKPQFVLVELNWGNALIGLGRPVEAIGHFEKALTGTQALPEAHNGFGLALAMNGRAAEAMPHFEEALRLKPGFAAAQFNLGNALHTLGRKAEAAAQWQAATQGDPHNPAVFGNLGAVLLELGRLPESIAASVESLRLRPDDVSVRCNLAFALGQNGRVTEALQQLDIVLRLQPNRAAARDFRAQLEAVRAADAKPR